MWITRKVDTRLNWLPEEKKSKNLNQIIKKITFEQM